MTRLLVVLTVLAATLGSLGPPAEARRRRVNRRVAARSLSFCERPRNARKPRCRKAKPPPPPPAPAPPAPAPPAPAPPPPPPAPGPVKQGGVTHPSWWSSHYATAESDRLIDEIDATGAGFVVLTVNWFQSSATSSSIFPRYEGDTATDDSLRRAVAKAKAAGLKVMLKPHVDLTNYAKWRGDFNPTDRSAWFASYTEFISHYARLATETGVDQLSVGTELARLSGDSRWLGVIQAVRGVFAGPLTYAANFDEYQGVTFWGSLDYIGIDAYFPLSTQPTTDVARLKAAWAPVKTDLAALSARYAKPVIFTEIGYVSQQGATVEPWNWTVSNVRSDAEQAAGYQAVFETFWNEPWFAGIHWWMWTDFSGAGEDQAKDYTPHGKPAEAVLRQYWAR